jgi:hypothetical protein
MDVVAPPTRFGIRLIPGSANGMSDVRTVIRRRSPASSCIAVGQIPMSNRLTVPGIMGVCDSRVKG